MLRLMIFLVLASPIAPYSELRSAATPSQIKFAIENQYDQTGPGAKGPETAYKIYKNLDEAIIGYLNDKDTKLPERERAKAFFLLYTSSQKPNAVPGKFFAEVKSPYHENSIEPTFKPSALSNDWRLQGVRGNVVLKDHSRWQKVLLTKSNPRSLSHYTREPEPDVALADFIKPKYSAPHAYQQEASSPQVSTQSAVIIQGPQLDTHTFKGATHDGGHKFQSPEVSSNAPAYPGPTHAPNTHSYKGATHVGAESIPSSPKSGSPQSYQGSPQGGGASVPGQTGSAHSFYSFTDGEGHQHTIHYRTDHRQTAHFV